MTKIHEIYRCEVCGNIVQVNFAGGGELVCCKQPMKLLTENSVDAATEKHVPVIEKIEGGVRVKIGEVPHPMDPDHFIEWIEVISGEQYFKKFLKPGEIAEVEFQIAGEEITARAYCNLHGLWAAKSS